MIPNANPLAEIGQISVGELETLALSELYRLLKELTEVKEATRQYENALHWALNKRFSGTAQQLRQDAGKTTGTVRFEVDGYVVVADRPKRLEYDQTKLKGAVESLRKWGEDPDDYVAIEIKVSESKYNAWPPAVRSLFEPARTLKVGKPSYKLEQIKSGESQDAANDSSFGEVV